MNVRNGVMTLVVLACAVIGFALGLSATNAAVAGDGGAGGGFPPCCDHIGRP
ncbi:MAG TPA: hypothetical protein VF062_22765 [Candidatus Limnocylindrales bacterium]